MIREAITLIYCVWCESMALHVIKRWVLPGQYVSVQHLPRKLVHKLCLLLILEAGARNAVWVVVGEVGRPLVLGVLRAHLEAGDTDPSIHLTHNQEAIFVTNITNMCSLITHIQTRQKK